MEHCLNQLTSNVNGAQLLQQLVNGLTLGAIYALIALGYSMVYGVLELINFAHGDVFMFGAFVTVGVVSVFGLHAGSGLAVVVPVLLLALVLSFLVCAVLGFSIEKVAYRPLRSAPRLAPLISAVGVSFVLEAWVATFVSSRSLQIPELLPGSIKIFLGVSISYVQILMLVVSVLMMVGLTVLVRYSRLGRGMRAVAQDREAAALMGVNLDQTISFTFIIGSGLAAVAGLLWTLLLPVGNVMGFLAGLKAFTAAVIGGIGNIPGAMVGGFALGLAEAFGASYASNLSCGFFNSGYQNAIAFAFLVVMLIFRPRGILGATVSDRA
ncbi:MAG TPA: branched-chain amino acid ABC transporter permease [Candidatus Solibacter sp.]|jgi:branched-chain amino acid transport system permease protein|nr:branched-chain amino acid ABC transporter permease [Candidatus Solibacter sp.]